MLDDGLALWFPGPDTATGEDLAELHLHGGRAVVAAVEAALAALAGLRRAEPGEFTRRAFANGRIDLAEAEGLADLLAAETEIQRRAAIGMAGGALSRRVEGWRERLLALSARLEAVLDFDDEADVGGLAGIVRGDDRRAWPRRSRRRWRRPRRRPCAKATGSSSPARRTPENRPFSMRWWKARRRSPRRSPGTTRDVLERPVALGGIPFTFVDMAGLRERGRR